jgi:hypothetical protein
MLAMASSSVVVLASLSDGAWDAACPSAASGQKLPSPETASQEEAPAEDRQFDLAAGRSPVVTRG